MSEAVGGHNGRHLAIRAWREIDDGQPAAWFQRSGEAPNDGIGLRQMMVRVANQDGVAAQRGKAWAPGRVRDTHELVISRLTYLAVYRLKGDVIEIARVLHGAQQWP